MYLVFDIGGTHTRIAASEDGQVLNDIKTFPTSKNFTEQIQLFKENFQQLTNGKNVVAVAGGVKGALAKDTSAIIATPILSDWINKPLKQSLQEIVNANIFLENDSLMAGLGEATRGAGQGKKIVAYIVVSTGVGGVRIVSGKVDENALGFEPGHQVITVDGNACGCGGRGHLEAYISGSNLELIYGKKAEEINDPKVWEQVAKYLAVGLNNLAVHWSPDIIILGGTVSQNIPLDALESYFKQALTIFPEAPELQKATLENPGLYGALEYLKQKN